MEEIVFLNDAFLPLNDAKISVEDYGFLFGYGIFETMRAYNGRVFHLDDHLERLKKSADRLGIPVRISDLAVKVAETIRVNQLSEARVRLCLSSGEGSLTPDVHSCKNPTLLITAVKYTPFPVETYEKGYKVMISDLRRFSQSVLPGMKTASSLENLLARREARKSGFQDAVMLNEKGLVSETISSNIFIVSSNILKTPGLENGILPGITRAAVLKLAAGSGLETQETDITPAELLSAEEVFITNSMIELMPVTAMGDKIVGNGRPGAVTRKLMAAYREEVIKETR